MLLDFLNLGELSLGIVALILLAPLMLIVYTIFDITKSTFKLGIMRWVFLALVLFAPFLGSLIYLFIRKNYKKRNDSSGRFN